MQHNRWSDYQSPCHDELLHKTGKPHTAAAELTAWLDTLDDQALMQSRAGGRACYPSNGHNLHRIF